MHQQLLFGRGFVGLPDSEGKGRLIRYLPEKGLSERLLAGLRTLYGEERIRDDGVLTSEARKRSLQLF